MMTLFMTEYQSNSIY